MTFASASELVLPPRSANFGAVQKLLCWMEPGHTHSRHDMEVGLQWTRHQSERNVLLAEYLGLIELDSHGSYGRFMYSLSEVGEAARAEYPSMVIVREQAKKSQLGQAILAGRGTQHYEQHRSFEREETLVSLCHRWSVFMSGEDIGFGGSQRGSSEKPRTSQTVVCNKCWLERLAHVPCDCEA